MRREYCHRRSGTARIIDFGVCTLDESAKVANASADIASLVQIINRLSPELKIFPAQRKSELRNTHARELAREFEREARPWLLGFLIRIWKSSRSGRESG